MKRIVYSGFLKFVASALLIICVVLGALCGLDGVLTYFDEKIEIYAFESDFSNSWYIASLLDEPENAVYGAYYNTYHGHDEEQTTVDLPAGEQPYPLTPEEKIRQRLDAIYCAEQIEYYVRINDTVITNCGATSPEDLMQGEYYSYVKRDEKGYVTRTCTAAKAGMWVEELDRLGCTDTVIVCCSVKPEAVSAYRESWERQEGIVVNTVGQVLVCGGVALLLLIYLLCVCGKDKHGTFHNTWVDYVWLEVHLAAVGGMVLGVGALLAYVLDEYSSGYFPQKLLYWAVGAAAALISLAVLTSLLSAVRNIKTKRLHEASVVFRVLRWAWRLLIKLVKWLYRLVKGGLGAMLGLLSRKIGVLLILSLCLYTAAIGLFGIGMVSSPIFLLAGVGLFAIAGVLVAFWSGELDRIQRGASEVRSGNVAYKIPALRSPGLKKLGENINEIAQGLDQSVAAQVKAERMKTELITNVSHDLKTPITSIISYAELLVKMEDLPEEARDYAAVIAKKGDRLKKLTQDLFDISKVQSGNDEIVPERLDVGLLINQTLGEHDGEIQRAGLPFCVDVAEGLYVMADGRKMSRVLSNLIDNVLKYAMPNTRVFVSAKETDGHVVIECKNISAYPLDFDAGEITGRFVRGDKSRTQEGNGLGLAIAKSYTELCGGSFVIVTDGDMFKAIIRFEKIS